jgi:hypothetical protein
MKKRQLRCGESEGFMKSTDVDGRTILRKFDENMEGSMNPSLDYLYQYPVKQVLPKVEADVPGYGIEFGGHGQGTGAIIGIENAEEIPELADKVLVTTIYTASVITLIFGNVDGKTNEIKDRVEVTVSPSDYFIIDPRFGGEPHYPGRPQIETDHAATIREQFEGRFAEGPDEPVEAETVGDDEETVEDTEEP